MNGITKEIYYAFDYPVTHSGIAVVPVKMKHYHIFSALSECLLLEKNSIRNPEIAIKAISMSYLEYLFFIANDDNKLLYLLDGLLRLITDNMENKDFVINLWGKDSNGKHALVIDGNVCTTKDFDGLRLLIAEQNMLDLPDEKIQKDVRDTLESAQKFKSRLSGSKSASLEEQIIALSLYSGLSFKDVQEMTIRKFILSIRRANHMIMSNIYLTAVMSGFVKFKDKSVQRGWLADLNVEDKYGDVKMSPEKLQSKANFEDAKGN
jgi:hypothetical protein